MGYKSAAAQEMSHPAILIGTGYHVLPRSRASATIGWHELLRRNSFHSYPDRRVTIRSKRRSGLPAVPSQKDVRTAGQPYALFGIFPQDFKDWVNLPKLLIATPVIEGDTPK